MDKEKKIYKSLLFVFAVLFLCHIVISITMYVISVNGIFSSLHNGKGIWMFAPDSSGYHEDAVKVVNYLHKRDWSGMRTALNELDSSHAKIIAVFYAIFGQTPLSFAPFNALCWVLSVIIVRAISLRIIPDNKRLSLGIAILFGLWPSYLAHTTQLLKDPAYVLGVLLFFYGCIYILTTYNHKGVHAAIIAGVGFFLINFIRPYISQAFYFIAIVTAVLVFLWKRSVWRLAILLIGIMTILTIVFNITNFFSKEIIIETVFKTKTETKTETKDKGYVQWLKTPYIPDFLEYRFHKIAEIRDGFLSSCKECGNIDANVQFKSAVDIIAYLPRALQVALLAPFPKQWFEKANTAGNISRRIASIEMVGIYCFLIIGVFLSLIVGNFRTLPSIWLLFFNMNLLVVFTLAIPNLGALYRLRYVYMLPIIIIGAIGWHNVLSTWKHSSKKSLFNN